jgi:hypothetical protein
MDARDIMQKYQIGTVDGQKKEEKKKTIADKVILTQHSFKGFSIINNMLIFFKSQAKNLESNFR